MLFLFLSLKGLVIIGGARGVVISFLSDAMTAPIFKVGEKFKRRLRCKEAQRACNVAMFSDGNVCVISTHALNNPSALKNPLSCLGTSHRHARAHTGRNKQI